MCSDVSTKNEVSRMSKNRPRVKFDAHAAAQHNKLYVLRFKINMEKGRCLEEAFNLSDKHGLDRVRDDDNDDDGHIRPKKQIKGLATTMLSIQNYSRGLTSHRTNARRSSSLGRFLNVETRLLTAGRNKGEGGVGGYWYSAVLHQACGNLVSPGGSQRVFSMRRHLLATPAGGCFVT